MRRPRVIVKEELGPLRALTASCPRQAKRSENRMSGDGQRERGNGVGGYAEFWARTSRTFLSRACRPGKSRNASAKALARYAWVILVKVCILVVAPQFSSSSVRRVHGSGAVVAAIDEGVEVVRDDRLCHLLERVFVGSHAAHGSSMRRM